MKKLIFIFLVLTLSACTSVTSSISKAPANNYQFRQVVNDVNNFIGREVRWGGKIINVSKDNDHVLIEIKQFPLNRYGFPLTNIPSQGRFIAQAEQIFDTDKLQQGLLITFSGFVVSETSQILKHEKHYLPVISIKDSHLWSYRVIDGKAYTITGKESIFRGYGNYGSGHYQSY